MDGIERLTKAAFVAPSTIELEFVDRQRFSLAIDLLGIPKDRIDWPTVKASPHGEKIVVNGINGDAVPIDAATVRYLVDSKYAAKIDKSINDLHMTPAEQEEAARLSEQTRDQRWYGVGDEDDLFE